MHQLLSLLVSADTMSCPETDPLQHGARRHTPAIDVHNASQMAWAPQFAADRTSAARPSFASFGVLFEVLDTFVGFEYVVYRSSREVERAVEAGDLKPYRRGQKDVDLLVNDYFLFKAITGARSSDRKNMRENGGGHIQSAVLVAGHDVLFDIRYVGDGYVDERWAADVLERRERRTVRRADGSEAAFHVPRADDYFFLLLYHCLLQKKEATDLAGKAKHYFAPLAAAAKVEPPPTVAELESKAPRLWDALKAYLDRYHYVLSCPTDPEVQLLPWNGGRAKSCEPAGLDLRSGDSGLRAFCFRGATWRCPVDAGSVFRYPMRNRTCA